MSVGRLVGLSVGQVTHLFNDPHVTPNWPTWPCFYLLYLSLFINFNHMKKKIGSLGTDGRSDEDTNGQ